MSYRDHSIITACGITMGASVFAQPQERAACSSALQRHDSSIGQAVIVKSTPISRISLLLFITRL